MPRAGLSREAVIDLAVGLADRDGFAAVTLASVAAQAGVATPSLYKHVDSLADLRSAVATAAVRELGRRSTAATVGRSGEEALRELGHAIRTFAREHPGLYAASQIAWTETPSDELLLAQADTVTTVAAVLRGFGLSPESEVDAVRAARSAIHGFVQLEVGNGFGMPEDVDHSFEVLLGVLIAGIGALARR